MCKKWYEFHKWEPVKEKIIYEFMGEKCQEVRGSDYSICLKCNTVGVQYGWGSPKYSFLNKCETDIFKKKIEFKQGVWMFKKVQDYTILTKGTELEED